MTLRQTTLSLLLVLVAATSFALRTRPGAVLSADFRPLHLGAQCLYRHCDPYNAAALDHLAQARGEFVRAIAPEAPVYPPSALVVVAPLAPLPWPLAGLLFTLLSALAAAGALASAIRRWNLESSLPGVALLLLLALSTALTDALQFGNPALLAVALASLAVTFSAWVPLGLALALKPQLAVPVLCLFLLGRGTRTIGARSLGCFAVLLALGVAASGHAAGSLHFLASLAANLHLAGLPGHSTYPGPANDEAFSFLNLQPLLLRVPHLSGALANALAWLTTLCVLAFVWLRRGTSLRPSAWQRRPAALLALLALASTLPVYHREYDRVLGLLLIPAVLELDHRTRWAYASLLALWLTSDLLFEHVLRRAQFLPWTALLGLLLALLLLGARPAPALIATPS